MTAKRHEEEENFDKLKKKLEPYEMRKLLLLTSLLAIFVLVNITLLSHSYSSEKPRFRSENELYPTTTKLLDLENFRYEINNRCEDETEFIIITTSNAVDFDLRAAQREAYPADVLQKRRFQRVFLLAEPRNASLAFKEKLFQENFHNRDIIQGNFIESYRNLSYKHIMGLKWAVNYCGNAKLILKMDDDIAVDFFQLALKVDSDYGLEMENSLLGYKQVGLRPHRNPKNKWFVTKVEFEEEVYPDFLSGWAWISTPNTAHSLVLAAQESEKIFWIDDVWVTGILAARIGAKLLTLNSLYTVYKEHLKCCLESSQEMFMCDFVVGPSLDDADLIRKFGQLSSECHLERPHECQRRKWEESVIKTCVNVDNPYFLPGTPGVGEAIKIG